MRYNFSPRYGRTHHHYLAWVVQTISWLVTAINLFFPRLYVTHAPTVVISKPVIYPCIEADVLKYMSQLSSLNIRLLSADIYPQEILIKGISFETQNFIHYLKIIDTLPDVKQDELVDWRRRKDGSWYFCLRIMFHP